MIGRADIEGSKSNVAMSAWLPQVSYPCGNFSGTSRLKFSNIAHPSTKGSIGHAFTVCLHTEKQNQSSFYPFVLREVSVLTELLFGRLRYLFTNEPPQPNSPFDSVLILNRHGAEVRGRTAETAAPPNQSDLPKTMHRSQRGFYPPATPIHPRQAQK